MFRSSIKPKEGEKVKGHYTVKAEAAEGDLEDRVNKKPFEFPQSAKIGGQILNGLNNLHKAGYVHGDFKLENVLLVNKGKEEYEAQVADFGKTRELGPGESEVHGGNPRFQAP